MCKVCKGSGSLPGSDYLDCSYCDAATNIAAGRAPADDAALRDAVRVVWEKCKDLDDCGPIGQGYQSDALVAGLATLESWLATPAPQCVPAGFVLVPKEPTPEMYRAACQAFAAWAGTTTEQPDFTHCDSYRAMIAAAPPQSTPEGLKPC